MTAAVERRTKCVRFEAIDGTVVRVAITSPVDLVMSNGETYLGGQFASDTSLSTTLSGGASSLDLGLIDDVDSVTKDEIDSGKWDNASIYYFATDWANPIEDEEEIALFTFGKVEESNGRFSIQVMGLKDRLNQTTGRSHTPTCLWSFADYQLGSGVIASDKSRCKLDHSLYTVTGTITSVTSGSVFEDSARGEVDDYFGNGEIIFTSGSNAGLKRKKVKAFASGGQITLSEPFYYLPEIGDSYTMIAGCRKRGAEDCRDKFSNRKRFGGFSYVPTTSQVTKFGSQ